MHSRLHRGINRYLYPAETYLWVLGSAEDRCKHAKLEFLGSQRTEGGENRYFRCGLCGDVLVVPPDSSRVYVIRGRGPKDSR
jgi:hypothetical protein